MENEVVYAGHIQANSFSYMDNGHTEKLCVEL